ncbi:DddA-like double-stranded DNA deaminase toxin [Flindersiella endophytica]
MEDARSAPELTEGELRHYQDQVLPPVEDPRERGKPTTAAVFDETGFRGLEVSGRDDQWSDLVEDWIDEYGWLPSRDRIETHVEAKVVAKMVRGELPEHITLVLNNVMCEASDPRVVSCRSFADESLLRGMSLRVYNNDGSEPLYIEGNA